MKLEWKKLTVDIEGIGHVARYLNTPSGVVLTGGQSGGHFTVDDCNVTDEGEFVPAPGLKDQDEAAEIKALQFTNKILAERQDEIVATLDYQDYIDSLPMYIADIAARMDLAESRIFEVRKYANDVLSSPQASAASKAMASAIVSILRGER